MINSIKDILRYYAYMLLLFLLAKVFFLIVNSSNIISDLASLPAVWWHGLMLDLSMASYLLVLPLLLNLIPFKALPSSRIWKAYIYSISFVLIVIFALDPFFYNYWGSKINFLFTQYLGDPQAAASSIQTQHYFIAFGFVTAMFLLTRKGIRKWDHLFRSRSLYQLLWLGLAFLLIRGGINKTPINISSAYFSKSSLKNNTAVNAAWGLMAYEMDRSKYESPQLIKDNERIDLMQELSENDAATITQIQLNDSSKVLMIILESFTSKTSALFSGNSLSYTPELDKLAQGGIYYTSAYASSFRSDRGLTALLTGMPSLAGQSLTNLPDKIDQLPNLLRSFNRHSYSTSFHYGGDVDFANLRVLLSGADLLIDKDFYTYRPSSGWGVHDAIVFDSYLNHIKDQSKGSFNLLFTLSSHEPFKVPNYSKVKDPYLNSISYTDSCLGAFVKELKKEGIWDNSLIVITADHGSILPERSPNFRPINYNVPIILAGGLVRDSIRVETVVSQFDIPFTLAELLGEADRYEFGHSLLQPSGHAFYNYYNGIAYVSDSCKQLYDIPLDKYLEGSCSKPYEKAYYQSANNAVFRQ